MKWFIDDTLKEAACGAAHAVSLQGMMQIREAMFCPRSFWTRFAANGCVGDDQTIRGHTKDQFESWASQISEKAERHVAELIFKTLSGDFYETFKEIADSTSKFADYFQKGSGIDDDQDGSLHQCVIQFREGLRDVPIPSSKQELDFGNMGGEETCEAAEKLYKQVISLRRNLVNFSELDYNDPAAFKSGGKASAIMQRSKFVTAKGEAGKQNSLILVSAELFPNKDVFRKPDAHKAPVPISELLKNAVRWSIRSRLNHSVCLFTDGRSRKISREFERILEAENDDEHKHYYGEIFYAIPALGDPRFPSRRSFASLQHREGLVALLPVPKQRMWSKKREHYSACGEKSTHASTYSKVQVRPWTRLPRLFLKDKEKICEMEMPAYADDDAAHLDRGHPLFWMETKEVEVYLALFQDFSVTHVFDVAAGSGAAAMAALILGITYEGCTMNTDHCNWLNRILDSVMFAVVVDSTNEECLKIKADVNQMFNTHVEEARKLLAGSEDDKNPKDDYDDEDDDHYALENANMLA